MQKHVLFSILVIVMLVLEGCARPYVQPASSNHATSALHETFAIMDDGYRLPLTYWQASGENQAILLALHGLNDYRKAFESTGEFLARRGITLIAYDQRGFGTSDGRGLWHGSERMQDDLREMIRLLHKKYPNQPVFLLGESMGGAVVLAAMRDELLVTAGIILVAPAIWSRNSMPFYQRYALWLTAHTMPALKLTGEGLDLHPSDNIDMLRALSRDPLVIKATRADVLYGMSNLMDQGVSSANKVNSKMLILYGKHDDIIPRKPTCQWLRSLPSESSHLRQIVIYENGYHMLTRDFQADVVLQDISDWINDRGQQIADRRNTNKLQSFCSDPVTKVITVQ